MPSYRNGKVKSLDLREPVFVRPEDTLRSVAHRMWVEDIGALVVGTVEDPVGIISERDLVAYVGQGGDADSATAVEAMTAFVVSTRLEGTLDDAAYLMLENSIRHLPVLDGEDRVVGMVSVRDLLRPLLSDGAGAPG